MTSCPSKTLMTHLVKKITLGFVYFCEKWDFQLFLKDVLSNLNFWVIDIPEFLEMFKIFLTKEMVKNMVVVITLNFEEPWDFIDQLDEWIKRVVAALSPTLGELSLDENDQMRRNLRNFILRFSDPIEDEQGRISK